MPWNGSIFITLFITLGSTLFLPPLQLCPVFSSKISMFHRTDCIPTTTVGLTPYSPNPLTTEPLNPPNLKPQPSNLPNPKNPKLTLSSGRQQSAQKPLLKSPQQMDFLSDPEGVRVCVFWVPFGCKLLQRHVLLAKFVANAGYGFAISIFQSCIHISIKVSHSVNGFLPFGSTMETMSL